MAFRPLLPNEYYRAQYVVLGLAALALLLLVGMLLVPLGILTLIIGFFAGLVAVAAAWILYRMWSLRRLDYWVDRDAVRILWSGGVLTLPIRDIRDLRPAPVDLQMSPRPWGWPLLWVKPASAGVSAFATQPPPQCLVLAAASGSYLISPADPEGFRAALQARQQLGPARPLAFAFEPSSVGQHWLRTERLPQLLLLAGFLLGWLLLGYVIWHYPGLPATIPMHFDVTGNADRTESARSVFLLPAITLLTWFFNALVGISLYERQRLAAYLLWGSAIALQVVGLLVVRELLSLVG